VQQMLGVFTGWLGESQSGEPRALYKIAQNTRRFLLALGDVIIAWLLQRQAEVALNALRSCGATTAASSGSGSGVDEAFYQGKVAAARFFAHEVLPRVGADRRIIESTDLELMDLPEAAF
jgi:hypothetical protein